MVLNDGPFCCEFSGSQQVKILTCDATSFSEDRSQHDAQQGRRGHIRKMYMSSLQAVNVRS